MSKLDEKIRETRFEVYHRANGRCEICNAVVPVDKGQLAHRIPNRKHLIEKYGKSVIHHPVNFLWTCPTDECNNAASIMSDPMLIDEVVKHIRTEILSAAAVRILMTPHLYLKDIERMGAIADGDV